MKYDRPYSVKQIRDIYGDEACKRLMKDPWHKFRAETGIELIHKEPTLEELARIADNWQLMSDSEKRISDNKSRELFGLSNKEHLDKLLDEY